MQAFIGSIIPWGPNFAPRGWAFCSGQLMSIAQNSAVFSLLGTMYGGDGRTTFGLPNLKGRVPVGAGHGPGLSDRRQGALGGNYQTVLNQTHLPAVTMNVSANVAVSVPSIDALGDSAAPTGVISQGNLGGDSTTGFTDGAANSALAAGTVSLSGTTNPVGGSQPFNNLQPTLGLQYIICLQGIYPSRS